MSTPDNYTTDSGVLPFYVVTQRRNPKRKHVVALGTFADNTPSVMFRQWHEYEPGQLRITSKAATLTVGETDEFVALWLADPERYAAVMAMLTRLRPEAER